MRKPRDLETDGFSGWVKESSKTNDWRDFGLVKMVIDEAPYRPRRLGICQA